MRQDVRTEDEEKRLNQKIRELQEKYPHVDMTQLFDTERAEKARKVLHKKAYASYKAQEFLKAGLPEPGKPEKPLSEAKRRLAE